MKNNNTNKQKLEASLKNLWEIYKNISSTATEKSKSRCPYKNAKDRCTANFECRNQYKNSKNTSQEKQLPICIGSDKLNYKNAWLN